MDTPKKSQLVDRGTAAAITGVTIRTIKRWAIAGRITQHRDPMNGRVWFDRDEMEAMRKSLKA
jgi:DNA-binding transcriptional MerR regulator